MKKSSKFWLSLLGLTLLVLMFLSPLFATVVGFGWIVFSTMGLITVLKNVEDQYLIDYIRDEYNKADTSDSLLLVMIVLSFPWLVALVVSSINKTLDK